MTDSKTFPNVEAPPYPGTGGNNSPTQNPPVEPQVQKDESLMSVMAPQPDTGIPLQTLPQPPSEPSNINPQNFMKPPQKGLPKVLIIALIALVVIIIVFAVVLLLKPKEPKGPVTTKGEITWWGIENDENTVSGLITEFQDKNPDVKIKYFKQSEKDYRERLTSALASGKGPDVFEIHNSWVPMFKDNLSPIPTTVIKKEDFNKDFYPVVSRDFDTASGILGLPLEYDALTLYINEDIFTSALKSAPKTWGDVQLLVDPKQGLTQKDSDKRIIQAGIALGSTENVDYWPEIVGLMMLQNGVDLKKPQGDQVKTALAYFNHFAEGEKAWDTSLPASTTAFAKNKVAMYFAPASQAEEIISTNPNLKFRTVELPQIPKEKPSDPDYSYATYWAESVWKRSSNSELAWNFIKFLSTPDSLQKLNQKRREAGLLEKAYPRADMAIYQKDDKILGSVLSMAPYARSWYLADNTNDGPTGINSQINKIFSDILTVASSNQDLDKGIAALPGKINTVISKYNSKARK